jgi:hypothetical protein
MKSIRTYLLLALLATITAVTFLSLLQGYHSSLAKTDALFDERLENLASIIVHANHDTSPRVERFMSLEPTVFFQIWSNDKTLIARSSNAPSEKVYAAAFSTGFHDVNFDAFRWRTFVLKDVLLDRCHGFGASVPRTTSPLLERHPPGGVPGSGQCLSVLSTTERAERCGVQRSRYGHPRDR